MPYKKLSKFQIVLEKLLFCNMKCYRYQEMTNPNKYSNYGLLFLSFFMRDAEPYRHQVYTQSRVEFMVAQMVMSMRWCKA